MVFIGGVRWWSGQRLGAWGPLVRPADHATWPSSQVSSLHRLWALDTLSTGSAGHVDKTDFGNVLTHGGSTKVKWGGGQKMDRWRTWLFRFPFLVSYFQWFCRIFDIIKICMDFGPYGAFLCHTRFLCKNQVLIVCMTQDQLFHTYGQNCSQITKCH
jgi:hypothetical protein